MNLDAEFIEPVTPASSYDKINTWNTEDSGYHTSFTPGSMECSELSNENLDPKIYSKQLSKSVDRQFSISPKRKCSRIKHGASCYQNSSTTSPERRGKKRPFIEDDTTDISLNSIPTPTSFIAGGIQKLNVNDTSNFNLHVLSSSSSQSISFYGFEDTASILSYPTTPTKKICRSNITKISPSSYKSSPLRQVINTAYLPKRSAKKLNFGIHSQNGDTPFHLSCQNEGLRRKPSKIVKSIFKPEQKIDIIEMLYHKVCCMPAIKKIFTYLDGKDIYNFTLVSPLWLQVCENVTNAICKRKAYMEYINNTKENCGSRDKGKQNETSSSINEKSTSSLRDIHNLIINRQVQLSPVKSPPGTPRTIRFRRFTKTASLDSRQQACCVRCSKPAKITEEFNGEEWAECSSITCAFQFCKFCKCERHPGKKCFQYDLEAPSPSKRKKMNCAIGTKKSRKNLRRLL